MLAPLSHDDPQDLGGYQPVARLGSGGMGTVYLARSDRGRTVALKTMHARIASDPVARTRFRLEVEAARVIGPVHGARVFAADPAAVTPWLATEYVLGPPLDEALDLAGPLPEPAVRALGALLCRALTQLHLSGVVHRDLKPSNIMLMVDGPKVIDFGIARAIGDERLTRTGAAAGTPAFMSPEQATGQDHTAAGDVFALAGVLTRAASGHGPFGSGQPADLLYRVRYAAPDLTGVPEGLLPILAGCLSKDPAERPTTTALAAALAPPPGTFAEHLPESLLLEIARRAAAVWAVAPYRLPPPADHALADTAPDGPRRRGLSRRGLLTLGGGTLLGGAAGAAGLRYLPGRDDPAPGKSAPPARRPAWDMRWQVKADYGITPRVPPVPLLLEELVVVSVSASSLQALDPVSGEGRWTDPDVCRPHQVTTDGKQICAIEYTLEETDPLTLCTVNLGDGKLTTPFARLPGLEGRHLENQVLGVAGGTVYVVGGHGRYSTEGFRRDQTWSLLAVDSRTGDIRWTRPLPARPDGSERLHFLTAQVRGTYLVLVQQSAAGRLTLAVLDTRTGRRLWDTPLDGEQHAFTRARLAVDDRHVYTTSGGLRALRLADGGSAWRFTQGRSGAAYSPPTVAGEAVYVVEESLGIVSVGASDGKLRWAEKGRADTGTVLDVAPAVGVDYVYSAATSALTATRLRTGVSSRPFRAAPGSYYPHEASKALIALGDAYAAGYPLL
ncbi:MULTISPECIES: protein kinase domain-containing protein [unclassified Streptomyces]|uniref:serine/threonine-protein kinase n=1 Tax=unclassified Streptomyces TaxID=2593676 RepID=UPI0022558991|nr:MULTISPECIES: serine/threonine-protein kinase [unclassified Streptomyces]MCX4788740.1 serine/threonine-protein kinase [Streptomyces sp. NBC_01221]WSJ36802.1 serine/threonine-protein kinase [Streptomyces sp. NBC_01321]WSP63220.1 serine/threonine-protein kinase [Streptomyces sp. NBC_01240]